MTRNADTKELAEIGQGSQVTIKRRKSKKLLESTYAPVLKVILKDRKVVMVPIDKASSDAQRSILLAKAREFVEAQLDKLKDTTVTPQEMKDVVKAVSELDALQREQYLTRLNAEPAVTPLGKGLQEVVRSAAAGAAEGQAKGFLEKMRQMDEAKQALENDKKVIPV